MPGNMIERAKAPACQVMFLTVDLPYRGQRHADIKNGLTVPPRMTMRNAWDMTTKVRWCDELLIGKRQSLRQSRNLSRPRHRRDEDRLTGRSGNSDQSLNWRDLDWIRAHGAARSCSRAFSTSKTPSARRPKASTASWCRTTAAGSSTARRARSRCCRTIVDAVGDRLEVLLDGGVRSGHDVYKALASGAQGCLIGRPFLYGLAAMGEAGVAKALEVIRERLRQRDDPHRRHQGRRYLARQSLQGAAEELIPSWRSGVAIVDFTSPAPARSGRACRRSRATTRTARSRGARRNRETS